MLVYFFFFFYHGGGGVELPHIENCLVAPIRGLCGTPPNDSWGDLGGKGLSAGLMSATLHDLGFHRLNISWLS